MKSKNSEISPEQARHYALRLLASRDYSRTALERKLNARGYDETVRQEILDVLEEEGWLNDRRYAERFAQTAMESGRYVGARLRMELLRRGFQDALVAEIMLHTPEGYDELREIRQLLARRFPGFDNNLITDKEKRRAFNFLLRRGYRTAAIIDAMCSISL